MRYQMPVSYRLIAGRGIHLSFFSQIVTMLRLTLMYYTNFIAFMEDPQKDECAIGAERAKSPPSEPSLFD